MKLFLIRHGETVDNVAQVYAGVKDSALTIHGNLQAERLGRYFTKHALSFTRIFSSDLQRAYRTANVICSWNDASHGGKLRVTALEVLREQDFGFYEGKSFDARSRDSNKCGKNNHRCQHQDDPNFQDVESKESLDSRANTFLEDHVIPLLRSEKNGQEERIAIVSHGIFLSHLWRCFLKLLPKNSVALSPGLSLGTGAVTPLKYLGGWSNTGYLELDVQWKPLVTTKDTAMPDTLLQLPEFRGIDSPSELLLHDYKVTIKTVNGKDHLQGLKRAKGGVGSSRFDEGQKSIESFFKKQKVG